MKGRIHATRDLPPRVVPIRVLNEMRGHALETHPEECCGLLVGPAPGRFEEVHRCRNEMTRLHRQDPVTWPRDGRQAFHMNEIDYQRVERHADEGGQHVTGVYHSHVDAAAYFSEVDQAFVRDPLFPFPAAEHVVLAVLERKVVDAAVFWLDPRTGRFEGRPLAPEAA